MAECIGCGYCCRKAPCYLGEITKNGKWCDFLHYNYKQKKWRCKLMKAKWARKEMAVGEGCNSPLNTLRRTGVIPTPASLRKDGR